MNGITPEVIDKIIGLKKPEVIEVGEFEYFDPSYKRQTTPMVDTLTVRTLQALCDFVNADKEEMEPIEDLIIHIASPSSVHLYGKIDPKYMIRERYLSCVFDDRYENPGWTDQENFNIFLQSQFVKTEYKTALLKFISSIASDSQVVVSDDQISQSVNIKTGLKRVSEEDVPNPVELRPFTTFPDIPQPLIPFVFRMRQNNGIQCKLIRADGGAYKLEAIKGIKEFLEKNINEKSPEGQNITILA